MSVYGGPEITNNGLVFAYDIANTQKSFKGAPTVNLITSPNPTTVGGAWGVTGLSAVTANAAIAPDGTLTATKLVASTSNTTFQFVSPASASQPTGTITYSCHMKQGEYTTGSLFLTQSGNNGAVFNLTNGTVVSVTGTGNTAAITPHPNGNGWWRCSVTNTGGTVSAGYRVGPLNGCLANVGGDGVSGIYVWNCQAEQQSFATPFVNGTRSTTQAVLDLTNNNTVTATSLTYASDGTFSFDGSTNSLTVPFNSSAFTFNNEQTIIIWMKNQSPSSARRNPYNQAYAGAGTITHENDTGFNYFYGTGGGNNTPYTNLYSSFSVVVGETAMICFTRNTSTVSCYKNGVFSNSMTNPYGSVVTGTNNITIGSGYAGGFGGSIYAVQLYNRALSAEEVQQNFNAHRGRFNL